jgi:hypothetical protein
MKARSMARLAAALDRRQAASALTLARLPRLASRQQDHRETEAEYAVPPDWDG